jgi:hypothetical protein
MVRALEDEIVLRYSIDVSLGLHALAAEESKSRSGHGGVS